MNDAVFGGRQPGLIWPDEKKIASGSKLAERLLSKQTIEDSRRVEDCEEEHSRSRC